MTYANTSLPTRVLSFTFFPWASVGTSPSHNEAILLPLPLLFQLLIFIEDRGNIEEHEEGSSRRCEDLPPPWNGPMSYRGAA